MQVRLMFRSPRITSQAIGHRGAAQSDGCAQSSISSRFGTAVGVQLWLRGGSVAAGGGSVAGVAGAAANTGDSGQIRQRSFFSFIFCSFLIVEEFSKSEQEQ
jgi:hypothetical protein